MQMTRMMIIQNQAKKNLAIKNSDKNLNNSNNFNENLSEMLNKIMAIKKIKD